MRVAVTGAGGFIGSSLCPFVVAQGHEVQRIQRGEFRIDAQAVVHLAGIAHRRAAPEELRRVNVDLAVQVGRAAAAAGAHMLFLSTLKVHGEESDTPLSEASPLAPRDPYARSKLRAEEALRAIPGLRLTVLRPPLAYGPGVKGNFLALLKALARGVPLPLAGVRNRRSLLYVGNLAHAVVRCLEAGHAGRTYLLSDGAALSSAELCRKLGEALGRPARLFPFPAVFLPRKLRGSLFVDDAAIRRELGWAPPSTLQQGLHATARWYRGR
jgi:nucleoside-diphosphate-sugar epimerase